MSLPARLVHPSATPLDRSAFPVTERWVYCNHAAVGPLPRVARDAVAGVLDAQMRDGCAGILDVESHLEGVRAETASALGATADEIAFMRSTSDGALVVAGGLDWREGDEIILPDSEFGANAYPWLNLRDRGVAVRFIRLPQRMTAETLERARTKQTRLVAVSYVSFLDGYRYDLAAIGEWCRSHGILFAVDAMQGFGHLPLDVHACRIDFCYFGTAKWLLSPQGLSVVFVRSDLVDRLRPTHYSWRSVQSPMTFLDYAQPLAPGARRLEGGTINYPALMGFRESLRVLRSASLEHIATHTLGLTKRLAAQARAAGIEVRSDESDACRSGIMLLGRGRHSVDALGELAADARIGLTVRDTGVRVSPHGYNTATEMDAVVELLAS
jgi:cysteine desulfurase/selenocysteine lyase